MVGLIVRKHKPENGICDWGYRGLSKAGDTVIHIPKAFSKHLSAYIAIKI
ncbi:MAG: hypothetical protein Q4A56_03945 [Porphyromonadaceae bacterium]|nr:hypothetical protein [Porphyromonadaceae bacterium]